MNLVEAYDSKKNISLIHHELHQNLVSDTDLALKALDELTEGQTLVSDGAYFSHAVAEKSPEKKVTFGFSALRGRSVSEETLNAGQFVIEPEIELIIDCPGGNVSLSVARDHDKKT